MNTMNMEDSVFYVYTVARIYWNTAVVYLQEKWAELLLKQELFWVFFKRFLALVLTYLAEKMSVLSSLMTDEVKKLEAA